MRNQAAVPEAQESEPPPDACRGQEPGRAGEGESGERGGPGNALWVWPVAGGEGGGRL